MAYLYYFTSSRAALSGSPSVSSFLFSVTMPPRRSRARCHGPIIPFRSRLDTFSQFQLYQASIIKFIWAAVIDSCYSERLGRRRTWLVLILPSLSVLIVCASFWFDQWVEQLDIVTLTVVLFTGQVLIASLDVCVDGWSLVLLTPDQVVFQTSITYLS